MQASHAAFEAGSAALSKYSQPPSIVMVQVADRDELEKQLQHISSLGIECASFYEPYDDMGLTAFSTLPILETDRHHFRHYLLWGRKPKKSLICM